MFHAFYLFTSVHSKIKTKCKAKCLENDKIQSEYSHHESGTQEKTENMANPSPLINVSAAPVLRCRSSSSDALPVRRRSTQSPCEARAS